ncbi:unnamed protein product [Urochloa decumbens]|uniref:Laccase n=1 Tax=Urochloa decumbens TaxID=240449 RepID=A0ABC9AWU3_9POAL
MAAVAIAFVFFLSATALSVHAAVVEHTFVVSQVNMTHLCKETPVIVVNGQLPGPAIEVTEGDSVVVHVVNKSPYNMTIHWHGVKQQLNCWADGVPMVTQLPILPNHNYTYRFVVSAQEGTLWWHAHVPLYRATVHGMLIIRPRQAVPLFPKPHKEVPIIIGEWWGICGHNQRLQQCVHTQWQAWRSLQLLWCHGGRLHDGRGAGQDILAPNIDALVVADASPGRYYMVALPNQPPKPDFQSPVLPTRGILQYSNTEGGSLSSDVPMSPEMPDNHDTMVSFYFHGNLTSLHPRHLPVPERLDERMFIKLDLGSVCKHDRLFCKRGDGSNESTILATMNNVSFHLPPVSMSLLEAHYNNPSNIDWLQELPDKPPRVFDFTDHSLIPTGPKAEHLEPTSKAALARRFRYGDVVEVVFQSTSLMQSDSNPMHLHGHDMFVLAQGQGNYDMEKDVARYNLVNPPVVNTVLVPRLGWVAVRFVADNPGAYMTYLLLIRRIQSLTM